MIIMLERLTGDGISVIALILVAIIVPMIFFHLGMRNIFKKDILCRIANTHTASETKVKIEECRKRPVYGFFGMFDLVKIIDQLYSECVFLADNNAEVNDKESDEQKAFEEHREEYKRLMNVIRDKCVDKGEK